MAPRRALEPAPTAALTVAGFTVVGLVVGAFVFGVPASGEFGYWETVVQVGLLIFYVVGWFLAWTHHFSGATTMAFTGSLIAALSAAKYQPVLSGLLFFVLVVPTVVIWWWWRQDHSHLRVAVMGLGFASLLIGGWLTAESIYSLAYGPKTPESTTQPLAAESVQWMWSGSLSTDSARVVARFVEPIDELGGLDSISLTVAERDGRSLPSVPAQRMLDDIVSFEISGLGPQRTYDYSVVVNEQPDTARGAGEFSTPGEGPYSFRFAFASCARTGSNAATFDEILARDPLFFLSTGDFHYADIADNDVSVFVRDYSTQLVQGAQAALYRQVPVAYVWDDHDFGPNDSNRESPARPAALAAYRALVPHYPLALDGPQEPIAQAFTIGRVRFVLTDLRSMRDPHTEPDGADKTMMGEEQRAWLVEELVAAAQSHALVVWMSSVPWIVEDGTGGDSWGVYTFERRMIADAIAAADITNLMMLAGDAHMIAADDGTNSNYSNVPGPGFPVFQAAPLDQLNSFKGGPYSEGVVQETGQFGLMEIDDDGERIIVRFQGIAADGRELLTYDWTVPE